MDNKIKTRLQFFFLLCVLGSIAVIIIYILRITQNKYTHPVNCGYVYNTLNTLTSIPPSSTTPIMELYRTTESPTIPNGTVIASFGMDITILNTQNNIESINKLSTKSISNFYVTPSSTPASLFINLDNTIYGITVSAFYTSTNTAKTNIASNLLLYSGSEYFVTQPPGSPLYAISFENTTK